MNTSGNPPLLESPFHQGEQFIQQKLGVREKMERFGSQVIRDHMPEQHRQFFAQLPFVFAGHADIQGWPWASILFEHPGFISSSNNKQLLINTKPVDGDPLSSSLTIGQPIGLLGIEPESRRRNRLSTRIKQISNQGIELAIVQAFGNCPQYIQSRQLQYIDPQSMPTKSTDKIYQFDNDEIELINNSDTFYVASVMNGNSHHASEGADVSHRGGKPGFVRIDDDKTLTIPDYLGNFHFNTLGNFLEYPKAGLLFIDFERSHLLTLTGSVEILWNSADTEFFAGAERLWKFRLDHGFRLKNALTLRWSFQKYSPNTSLTGSWSEAESLRNAEKLKNSWQPYQITKIIKESEVIKSFYFQPPINQKPNFLPGQFLTVKAIINGKAKIRTYTVSSAPSDHFLRVSVKHEQATEDKAEGIFSSYLHQHVQEGDTVEAKAPTGEFTFDSTIKSPAVLVSAGIGITPMIAMIRQAYNEGIRTRYLRPITFICCARNAAQRAFFDELNSIAAASAGMIRVFWALTQPESHLQPGTDYHHHGRLSKQLFQSILTDLDYDVYLCGPAGFMQSQYDTFRELNIFDKQIFAEAFGPSSLIRNEVDDYKSLKQLPVADEAIIRFTESDVEQAWSKNDGSLLEFAEAHGLTPSYGCRNGQCGTCKVKLLSGNVSYIQTISAAIEKDEVLICCAVPAKETEDDPVKLEIKL